MWALCCFWAVGCLHWPSRGPSPQTPRHPSTARLPGQTARLATLVGPGGGSALGAHGSRARPPCGQVRAGGRLANLLRSCWPSLLRLTGKKQRWPALTDVNFYLQRSHSAWGSAGLASARPSRRQKKGRCRAVRENCSARVRRAGGTRNGCPARVSCVTPLAAGSCGTTVGTHSSIVR